MKDKIYSCEEHIGEALDDFVNNNESAPQMKKVENAAKCSYCTEDAVYIIED